MILPLTVSLEVIQLIQACEIRRKLPENFDLIAMNAISRQHSPKVLLSCPAVAFGIRRKGGNAASSDSQMPDVEILFLTGKVQIVRVVQPPDVLLNACAHLFRALSRTDQHDEIHRVLGSRQNHQNRQNREQVPVGPEIRPGTEVHDERHGI